MKYLLDTSIVSDYFRRVSGVAEAMHAVAPHELAISTVTEHEMRYGLALQPAASKLRAKVESFLGVVSVLAFDSADAAASAEVRATLDARGESIGPFDGLIAGCAVARRLTLVTANVREFRRVRGLTVENWRR